MVIRTERQKSLAIHEKCLLLHGTCLSQLRGREREREREKCLIYTNEKTLRSIDEFRALYKMCASTGSPRRIEFQSNSIKPNEKTEEFGLLHDHCVFILPRSFCDAEQLFFSSLL